MPTTSGQHSKPSQPKPGAVSREEIREQAFALVKDGPATATALAKAIGVEAALVAIALSIDSRFARSVVNGVMQWGLVAEKKRSVFQTAVAPKPAPRPMPAAAAAPEPVRVSLPNAPTLVIEEIDPERAKALLAMSRGNRKLRPGHLKWLAQQIVDGCWRVSHQAIAVSITGRLLDGHHRLHAVLLARKPILSAVSYGWQDETWDALDCGVVRLPQDRLDFFGDHATWNRRAVEMIHSILRLEQGSRGKATNQQLIRAWKAYRPGIALVRKLFPTPIHRLTRTPMLGALVRYHQDHPDKAIEFAMQLLKDRDPASPSQQLRAWLLSGEFVGCGYRGNQEVYWRSVAAMVAHRDGRRLEQLTMATTWSAA